MKTALFIVAAIVCAAQILAAPQPFDWRQLGKNIGKSALDFGRKAVPIVKGGCQLVNGQQQYPPAGYPQYYPNYYPQYNPQNEYRY